MDANYLLTKDELDNLPEELLKEIRVGVSGKRSRKALIHEILSDRGGSASIDQIIVDLYKKTSAICYRNNARNTLDGMAKSSEILKISMSVYAEIGFKA